MLEVEDFCCVLFVGGISWVVVCLLEGLVGGDIFGVCLFIGRVQ